MEEEAYQNDDGDKEAYAQLMRETLDGLVGDIRDFEDGNVQSLESVANHQIAKETKKYLQRLQLGTLTDEYKADYAKRVTALIEVRGALHHQNQLKKMNIEPLPASTSEDDGEVGDDDMDKEKIDTEETREEQEVIARQSAQYEETKQRQRERWQQQREAEQKRREEQERINRARQAVVEAARQSRAEQTTQETNSRLSENEKTPASYQIEAGIGTPETTITVGQEIPASWFEAKTLGEERGGFGIHITKPPLIESFLQDILNTEFSKIDQAERKDYDYAAISRKLKEEAGRTRKIPDVAAVIQANKLVMENEDEMEM